MTSAEYRKLGGRKPAKYRNTPTVVDGQRFDSKLEAKRYGELKALVAAGAIKWFIRQAPFRLPGGIVYRADFLIVWVNGQVTVEDSKGVMTAVSALKIKQVEAVYGITVQIIRKAG